MRINNPVKFSKGSDINSADNALASIGDVKKICGDSKNFSIFVQEFSEDGSNWHTQQNSNDIFVRYSFDGGVNWQISSSYQGDTFILKNGDSLFSFNNYTSNNGTILLTGNTGDNALLGAILSSIINNNTLNIPSASIGIYDIIYDFCSIRNNR